MSLDACLGRKYKLEKTENFDEVMRALGVGILLRKVGNSVTPVMELTRDGDTFTLKTTSTFKNTIIKFRLGEEFDDVTPDGRKVKATITQDGNKLVHIEKGDKITRLVYDFSEEEVKMTIEVDGILCTRIFRAQG